MTGISVLSVGDITVDEEFNRLAEEDLLKGEGLGLVAALIVLVIVFGALVAAGVPLVLAIVSIFVAVGLTAMLGRVMGLSFGETDRLAKMTRARQRSVTTKPTASYLSF